ncbi:hypothetical protein BDV95DRAFT_566783 [Massariosphaeria phaeospora]|uniref:Uncharacterized protein n=1 Tax=Massariosphaeria phaeospora TaxID=100035 RepID=A0A7C8IHX6_9PLEO|nr:hypothetical protein BDV95DRAFT_566783 [Massariosphaeria phaeospora]
MSQARITKLSKKRKRTNNIPSTRTLQYYMDAMDATPKKRVKKRLDFHFRANIPKSDPKHVIRGLNSYTIQHDVEHELEVDAAFEETRREIQSGRTVKLTNPFEASWELYSSQYYGEWLLQDIDIRDFRYEFAIHVMLCFHDVKDERCNTCTNQPSGYGWIEGYKELAGTLLERLKWPKEGAKIADLEPMIVKTEGSCGEVRIWFAGDGYLKMECELKARGKKALVCSFSGIQLHEKRQALQMEKREAEHKKKWGTE